jgi:hypothetical protein
VKRPLLTLTVLALLVVPLAAALPAVGATNLHCGTSGRFVGNSGTQLRYKLRCNFPVERVSMRSSAPLERLGAVKTRRGSHLRCGKRPHNRMACRGRLAASASAKQTLQLKRVACTKTTFRFQVSGPDVQSFRVALRQTGGCATSSG